MLYKIKYNKYSGYQLVIYKDNRKDEDKEIITNSERDYLDESAKRAKRTILEYSRNNSFKWFVTFTFDINKIDRYDYELVKKKLLKSIDYYKSKYKNFAYIITPELHTKKEHEERAAIHFHALFSDIFDLKYVGLDVKTGHKLFKSEYFFKKFGRCMAIRIFDYSKFVAYYISKYITKDDHRIFTRRYFVSKGLDKAQTILDGSYDFNHLNSLDSLLPTFENSMVITYDIEDITVLQKIIEEIGEK